MNTEDDTKQIRSYSLSPACEAPVQPTIKPSERDHPRFQEYMRYRRAMDAQLVSCPSFENWLSRE